MDLAFGSWIELKAVDLVYVRGTGFARRHATVSYRIVSVLLNKAVGSSAMVAPDYALLALEGRWATLYSLAQVSVHISLKEDLAG